MNEKKEISTDKLVGVGIAENGSTVNQTIHNYNTTKTLKNLTLAPKSNKVFIGREDKLKEIEELLSQDRPLLLLSGIGGIGKSSLSLEYYLRHKDNFDHCGYIEVEKDIEYSIVNALEKALKIDYKTVEEGFRATLLKLQNLEGKKLLVVDNIRDAKNQESAIKKLLGLTNWQILITSRESIEGIEHIELDRLSLKDARELFKVHANINSDEESTINTIDEILKYLDRHTLFVEQTAKALAKNSDLTLEELLENFKSGKLPKIRVARKETFNNYLQKRFTLDNLDNEQILLLKKLTLLPSIELPYETIKEFIKIEDLNFLLDELKALGWLSGSEQSYKLHQIIKEFILANHTPTYEEIKEQIDYFMALISNSANPQTAIDVRDKLIFFESIVEFIERVELENKKIATLYNHLGNIYHHLGEYEKALPLYEKALEIHKKVLGEEHPSTATSYNNLAGLYCSLGEYEKALPLFEKDLKISEKVLGEEHPDTATSYNNLAGLYQSLGEYEKALPLYEKALEISKKVLGEEHPDTAISYGNLAGLYRSLGEYEKALPLYEKALEIKEKVLGEEHPNTATSYNDLAGLYESLGDYEKALPLYEEALNIYKKVLGEKHPHTATSYNNLAVFYFNQSNFEKAYEFMQKAVNVCEKVLPPNHPNLLNSKKGLEIIKAELKS